MQEPQLFKPLRHRTLRGVSLAQKIPWPDLLPELKSAQALESPEHGECNILASTQIRELTRPQRTVLPDWLLAGLSPSSTLAGSTFELVELHVSSFRVTATVVIEPLGMRDIAMLVVQHEVAPHHVNDLIRHLFSTP